MKYLVAPASMPDELTWFKWEAYTTWLSGFALMVVVYYLDAELFLVDKSIMDLSPFRPACSASAVSRWPGCSMKPRAAAGWPDMNSPSPRRLRLPGRPDLRLHPCPLRPRRVQPDRRDHRHHHGRQRVHADHPQPEEDRRGAIGRPVARPEVRQDQQGAIGPQQLPDLAGGRVDDQQSLSAAVRDTLQLADRSHHAGARTDHPAFLQ